jgi:predicted ArsR family transcriptional regulator
LVGGTARQPVLRLCHCPIRDVVDVTRLPCRFEEELVAELLGSAITREEYIPDGQASCSYRCSTKSPTSRREFA